MSDDTHPTPALSSTVDETVVADSVPTVTTSVGAPHASSSSSSVTLRTQGTQTPHQSELEGLKVALKNYNKEKKANVTEVLIAQQYGWYCKRKSRIRKDDRRFYLEGCAQNIRNVTGNRFFSYNDLKKAFNNLERSERERERRLLNAKRKRDERDNTEQARHNNESDF